MSLEALIRQAKPSYVQADIQEVTSSILQRLEQSETQQQVCLKTHRSSRNLSWKKRTVSVVTVLGFILVGMGTVALADGVNFLNVVVQFMHNITNGGGFGAGYSLEHTKVSLTLKGNSSTDTTTSEGAIGSVQQANTLSTTQVMSDGGLFDTGYNAQLESYLETAQFPKLIGDNIAVSNIRAYSIGRSEGIFYMYVNASIPNSNDQTINLDMYHKTGGSVVINGQTVENIKNQVDLSGISATYVEFTNNKSFLNYLTWKSGDWIFVLRSNNVPKQTLIRYAQDIEKQAIVK